MLAAIASAIVELTLGPIRGANSFHLILGFDRVSKYVRACFSAKDAVHNILSNILKGHPVLIA